MREVVIVSALRSGLSRAREGALASLRPDELLADLLREMLARLPQLDLGEIGDVVIGCATPEAEQGLCIARLAASLAGIPFRVPAHTVSRLGLSGLTAITNAAALIASGQCEIVVAGGVDSPSRVPFGGYNPSLSPRLIQTHPDTLTPRGLSAEKLARKLGLSRADQDAYALISRRKARQAVEDGAFFSELLALHTPDGSLFDNDDRRDPEDADTLAALPARFQKGGSVTLGNTAIACDGAAVFLMMRADKARALGLTPLCRLLAARIVGGAPDQAGLIAIDATRAVLAAAELTPSALDIWEVEEDTAVDALAFLSAFDLAPDSPRVNPHGGALALGMLEGAGGARQLGTLLGGLARHEGCYGLLAQCSVGGQGAALLLGRC